jgi:hypothetical protein
VKELHVTIPLMAGPAVLEAQQKLRALGYAPGKLDGQYGPATAGFNAIEGNTASATTRTAARSCAAGGTSAT